MKLYAIKDVKIGFGQPFMAQNNAVAVRAFTNSRNATEPNVVNTNPEDKELWFLGDFNENTGEIESKVEYIVKAEDVRKEQ